MKTSRTDGSFGAALTDQVARSRTNVFANKFIVGNLVSKLYRLQFEK